jgi:DNA-binding beta-propeller fold protein YncE
VTDEIRIVARPGGDAPAPIAVAAGAGAVWVLNGNTATVSRIDPRTRGLTDTISLTRDQAPRGVAVDGRHVWVAGFDGSATAIPASGGRPRSSFVGVSLAGVTAAADRVWLAAVAIDRQLGGGSG